jgi:hypothetical protein
MLVVILVLSTLFMISPVKAQPLASNAYGFYLSPTTHRFKSAPTKYELYQTNTGQDTGIFYSRLIASRVNIQVEGRYSTRILDINFGDLPARINEIFIEIPVLVHATRTHRVASSPLRVYAGFGLSCGLLIRQEIDAFGTYDLPLNMNRETKTGGYKKISCVMDGGAVFTFHRRTGIFAGLRVTTDWETFGESDDVPVAPKYIAYGFQAGFELRFGSDGRESKNNSVHSRFNSSVTRENGFE